MNNKRHSCHSGNSKALRSSVPGIRDKDQIHLWLIPQTDLLSIISSVLNLEERKRHQVMPTTNSMCGFGS